MKHTEFRIGNIISIPACGIYARIKEIREDGFRIDLMGVDLDESDNDFAWDFAEAVNLTEQLLERCGFKESADHNIDHGTATGYVLDNLLLWGSCYDGIDYWMNVQSANTYHGKWGFVQPKIDSLHMLQNLHSLLTGQELEINL